MKALDTNVLVRFLVDAEGNPDQHEIAAEYIETHCTADSPCAVATIALCELAWVFQRVYKISRADIADEIASLLEAQQLKIPDRELIRGALADYRKSSADFPDHLIAWIGKAEGAEETATFDKKAGKAPLFLYIGR